jgi:DUF1365 family protein
MRFHNASALYEGIVQHRRYTPVAHAFRYSLCMLYVDLAELPMLFEGRWLWSARRPALAEFRRSDYLGDPEQPLVTAVGDVVEAHLGRRPTGAIRLLTQPRYFGLVFNPISVYYCFDKQNQLDIVVLEVSNTPWGERCTYVVEAHTSTAVAAKQMHVSPFMDMDMHYRFTLNAPGEALTLHIACVKNGAVVLDAALQLQRREITTTSLHRVLWRYPFMTGKVMAAIYYQALRLWWKRVPFVPHPQRTAPQGVTR